MTAWGLSHTGAEIEVLAYLRVEYEDIGVTGYVHVSWLDPKKVRKVVVVGKERMAVYNDLAEERLRIYDRGVEFEDASSATHERPLSYRYGDILSPHIQFHEPLSLEDRHFVECIRTGAAPVRRPERPPGGLGARGGGPLLHAGGAVRSDRERHPLGFPAPPYPRGSAPMIPLFELSRLHAEMADDLERAWQQVREAGAFVGGEFVERFEAEWAGYCGAKHCGE